MQTKKGDFVEIDYVAKDKESGKVFDLTSAEVAKKEHIHNAKFVYKPIIICLGEHDVIKGLDSALIGKEPKKKVIAEIAPEEAFGKKNPKLLQLIATSKLLKNKIRPFPGLQLNIDNNIGVVKSVSGGRTLVDFNHPLAGRVVVYEATINRIITKPEEQLQALVDFHLQQGVKTVLEKDTATIKVDIPKAIESAVTKKITSLIPTIKHVVFKSDTVQ